MKTITDYVFYGWKGAGLRMDGKTRQFVDSLVGRKLANFCCEAEIMDFSFGPLALHAMGCTRILKGSDTSTARCQPGNNAGQ